MRILALMTDAFGGHGGIARYNQAVARALASSALVSEILILPRKGRAGEGALPPKAAQLAPVGSRIAYSAHAVWLALNGKFDVVLCGHLNMCALASSLAKLTRARLWLQIHGIDAWHPPKRRHLRAAAERADIVTAVSRYTRNRFLAWADVDPLRVRVLPNTFEPGFSPGLKPRHLVERLGLEGRKVILTVSRLAASERYKGHDRIIGVLPDILRKRPATAYVIVGSGDDVARLEHLVRAHDLEDAVRFVGDIPDHEMPEYYRLADAFVMPSTGEGFGIVYLEAIASGIPVLAGNRDGSRDALADGALGTLIDPDDRDELSAAIISMMEQSGPTHAAPSPSRFAFENFARHVDELLQTGMPTRPPMTPNGSTFDRRLIGQRLDGDVARLV